MYVCWGGVGGRCQSIKCLYNSLERVAPACSFPMCTELLKTKIIDCMCVYICAVAAVLLPFLSPFLPCWYRFGLCVCVCNSPPTTLKKKKTSALLFFFFFRPRISSSAFSFFGVSRPRVCLLCYPRVKIRLAFFFTGPFFLLSVEVSCTAPRLFP